MIRFHITAAAIALGLAAASGTVADEPADPATLTAESSAMAVSGNLEVDGKSVTIRPQLEASGSAPPAYDKTKSQKSYHNILKLPFLQGSSLSVQVGATVDKAASNGQKGSKATATAASSIKSLSAEIINPAFGSLPLLAVSATTVASDAKFVNSNTAPPSGSGTVSLTGLTVNLSVFRLGMVTYTGTPRPKPNTIFFNSPDGTVIVYLNRQITTLGAAVSGPNASVPTSIEVDAIDVHLTNADVSGEIVSGDLLIATSFAD